MSKVMKSFICSGCLNMVTSAGHTSVHIGASAKLELVDKFCYLVDMLGPSCRLPTASPGRWIGGRPPDMVASCDLSG